MCSQLIFSHDYDLTGIGRRSLAERCRTGELTRVRNGVYVRTQHWASMPWWDQYRIHVEAAVSKGRSPRVLVWQSAAVIWGMPVVGKSTEVQLLAAEGCHGLRRAGMRWHASKLLEPLETVDGYAVTSRAQTAVDVAGHLPFEHAVPVLDHVLRPDRKRNLPALARSHLHALADQLPTKAKSLRAHRVIDFADPRAQLPGESLSRALMYLFHFPAPELQYAFHDTDGRTVGITDFYWKEKRLVGEFDGTAKYSNGEYLKGQTPVDRVVAEKKREDRIRACGVHFVRWTWDAAWQPESHRPSGLVKLLLNAGLKQDRWNNRWPGVPPISSQ